MSPVEVRIADELAGRVRLGVLSLEGLRVSADEPAVTAAIEELAASLRARHAGSRSAEVPGTELARSLYKSLGLDPTKTRPSSEALLRRALKAEALYRVNSLVDAANLCSLRHQLPYGLYDLGRLQPPILLRLGAPGESYEGIRKGPVNVEARPVLADARGAFGNPTSDSARSAIGLETRSALVTVYAPPSLPAARLEGILADTEATLLRFCGGRASGRALLPEES